MWYSETPDAHDHTYKYQITNYHLIACSLIQTPSNTPLETVLQSASSSSFVCLAPFSSSALIQRQSDIEKLFRLYVVSVCFEAMDSFGEDYLLLGLRSGRSIGEQQCKPLFPAALRHNVNDWPALFIENL
jgi:hypothetical protein